MKKTFKDIKVGDTVTIYNEYLYDYIGHRMKVTSVEYDDEYKTETNPNGVHAYGDDLDYEEDDEEYLTHIYEENFVCFYD